ncbi:DUF5990 family protein [Chitinimonas koreensis]|uniref:DUF5990 family protein n=1 Tax=Chitinimonas koreensis TaxID=356302 RepID=UPI0009FC6E04|nr:DUF5990 family protein [Chitinimonas koreensis]QNM95547.1 hypothetical protein H9L41_16990 [Chitinimonas koreensis]
MRIVVVAPPLGVRFAVQRGKSELLESRAEQPDEVWFEFELRLGAPLADGSANFLGEFAQGAPTDRFVYVNSGTQAGQPESCWSRRAKLKLASIPKQLVQTAISSGEAIIQARIAGTMGDGGPICASVKPSTVEWSLVRGVA